MAPVVPGAPLGPYWWFGPGLSAMRVGGGEGDHTTQMYSCPPRNLAPNLHLSLYPKLTWVPQNGRLRVTCLGIVARAPFGSCRDRKKTFLLLKGASSPSTGTPHRTYQPWSPFLQSRAQTRPLGFEVPSQPRCWEPPHRCAAATMNKLKLPNVPRPLHL